MDGLLQLACYNNKLGTFDADPGAVHPNTSCFNAARKTWMAGMKPAMTWREQMPGIFGIAPLRDI
jgi:hypothetical protein